MTNNIPNLFNTAKLTLKNYAPEIMVVLGIGGMATGGVLACCASRKLDKVYESHHERVRDARGHEESNKELTLAYLRTGIDVAKLYAPSLAITALSAGSILAGNNILRKRNVALAAAYIAVDRGFKDYRSRVVERFGEDVDNDLRYNLHKEVIESEIEDENGTKKSIKQEVIVGDDTAFSDYARYFGKGLAKAAEANDDYNRLFLDAQQRLANETLRANGFLMLNDVYELLGIDPSLPGQMVGWIYDKHDNAIGSNYVDFRIQEIYRKDPKEPNGYQKVFLIDPNVDGDILTRAVKKGLLTM